MTWDSGLLLWMGIVLLAGAAVLLVAAIASQDLRDSQDDSGGEPGGHKSAPRYTLDDWT